MPVGPDMVGSGTGVTAGPARLALKRPEKAEKPSAVFSTPALILTSWLMVKLELPSQESRSRLGPVQTHWVGAAEASWPRVLLEMMSVQRLPGYMSARSVSVSNSNTTTYVYVYMQRGFDKGEGDNGRIHLLFTDNSKVFFLRLRTPTAYLSESFLRQTDFCRGQDWCWDRIDSHCDVQRSTAGHCSVGVCGHHHLKDVGLARV